jgi:putative transposase
VLVWRLSNLLDASFCIETLEEALSHGRPEIFNTDQGSQFTDDDFTGVLRAHGVAISMDGRGRFADNIFVERLWRSLKYEEVVCCGKLYRRWGPPESACRGRLQTATSCEGKEPWW